MQFNIHHAYSRRGMAPPVCTVALEVVQQDICYPGVELLRSVCSNLGNEVHSGLLVVYHASGHLLTLANKQQASVITEYSAQQVTELWSQAEMVKLEMAWSAMKLTATKPWLDSIYRSVELSPLIDSSARVMDKAEISSTPAAAGCVSLLCLSLATGIWYGLIKPIRYVTVKDGEEVPKFKLQITMDICQVMLTLGATISGFYIADNKGIAPTARGAVFVLIVSLVGLVLSPLICLFFVSMRQAKLFDGPDSKRASSLASGESDF